MQGRILLTQNHSDVAVSLDVIVRSIQVAKRSAELLYEMLADHDATLGRTTDKNRRIAEELERSLAHANQMASELATVLITQRDAERVLSALPVVAGKRSSMAISNMPAKHWHSTVVDINGVRDASDLYHPRWMQTSFTMIVKWD